jgi:hypothetical protein
MMLKILLPLVLLGNVSVEAKPLSRAEVLEIVDSLGLGNADHRQSVRLDFEPVQNMLLLAGVHCSLFVVEVGQDEKLLQKLPTRYSGSYCRIKSIGFHDLDADGDKDMLVISESRTDGPGEFMYFDVADGYRNTGSAQEPFEHLPQWADGSDASKGFQKVLRWAKKNPMQ